MYSPVRCVMLFDHGEAFKHVNVYCSEEDSDLLIVIARVLDTVGTKAMGRIFTDIAFGVEI